MTTVAYRAGIIAADRLVSFNGCREGLTTKIVKRGRVLAGAAGSAAQCQRFLEWVAGGCMGNQPALIKDDYRLDGFVVTDERLICFNGETYWTLEADFYALGSGEAYARGAMAMGAGPARAVRIAARFDSGTGREVDVLKAANG